VLAVGGSGGVKNLLLLLLLHSQREMMMMRHATRVLTRSQSTLTTQLGFEPSAGLQPLFTRESLSELVNSYQRRVTSDLTHMIKDTDYETWSLVDIVRTAHGKSDQARVAQHAAHLYNLDFFLQGLSRTSTEPTEEIKERLVNQFDSYDAFQRLFTRHASSMFGSGSTWLCEHPKLHTLHVFNTYHTDTPLVRSVRQDRPAGETFRPLLALHLWEHAYIRDFGLVGKQEYVDAWWKVVDWNQVWKRMGITAL
jgi:Fe-Mn family superoxide dismutase